MKYWALLLAMTDYMAFAVVFSFGYHLTHGMNFFQMLIEYSPAIFAKIVKMR